MLNVTNQEYRFFVFSNLFFNFHLIDTVERTTAALCDAGSIPARCKYLYGLQVVVSGLPVCVCGFSMFVNAPTI